MENQVSYGNGMRGEKREKRRDRDRQIGKEKKGRKEGEREGRKEREVIIILHKSKHPPQPGYSVDTTLPRTSKNIHKACTCVCMYVKHVYMYVLICLSVPCRGDHSYAPHTFPSIVLAPTQSGGGTSHLASKLNTMLSLFDSPHHIQSHD